MDLNPTIFEAPSREKLVHALYEAAELEHNLMGTYLYAAFSLKSPGDPGLSEVQGEAVARWRRAILDVAIDEMGQLAAVWNVTSAVGATPRFGRTNFPLDPGYLPETALPGIHPVECLKTALAAFDAIVAQREGAQEHSAHSHFQRFIAVREDYHAFLALDPERRPGVYQDH